MPPAMAVITEERRDDLRKWLDLVGLCSPYRLLIPDLGEIHSRSIEEARKVARAMAADWTSAYPDLPK